MRTLAVVPGWSTIVWVAAGLLLAVVIWKVGIGLIRGVTMVPPEPPPPGELRKVTVRYRCESCGMEIKSLMAPDEDPPPPKHCMEDMVVVPPKFE